MLLDRPLLSRPTRILLGASLAACVAFGTGVVTTGFVLGMPTAPPPAIPARSPAPPIIVPSIVVVPAPAAPAPAVPAAPTTVEAATRLRATHPRLDADCVGYRGVPDPGEPNVVCGWDNGFPAISANGATIADTYYPGDGGRGNPGLSIRFIDAKTSAIVRDTVVLSPDEYVEAADPHAAALRATVARRVATVQRELDVGAFRTMTQLDAVENATNADTLRTETVGDAVRVIDPATSSVVWQNRFAVEDAFPPRPLTDNDPGCYPSSTHGISIAWDAPTKTVYAEVTYQGGPCWCNDEIRNYVRRLR